MDLEKLIKTEIKSKSKLLSLDNHAIRVNNKGGKILLNKSEIGTFNFDFSKGKFIEYGAVLGVKLDVYIEKSQIDIIIEKLNLSFPKSNFCRHFFMWINSFDYKKESFYKDGKVVFFPKDDIEKKALEMIEKIQEMYFSKVNNYINHTPSLVDDVLSYSSNYSYPLTSIIINKYLNNDTENLDSIIELAKSKKLYDAKDNLIVEIKEKVGNYFGNG
ncbi:hypothetical protein ACE1MK_13320 [Tenacibaculum maritimum]|uniref:hypothetical protein n=1 Tax=Tenacibaculum maritimum TaxID=107401 RepID=UPI0012E5669A|nr:hypothetical protein [Tenacibaculum maritimum]MCD9583381.1 hypothetical protein [Tenacibaculum maritimum]MCD9637332.1 hypothetical protein [Tenacibaculum maritimum]CAA0156624.1 conserved hypothetical protein [Tenacibaculum maritimum]CAA0263512.1 conserved hypothetical protein [Tenacibaculum maritimum]